MKSLFPEKIHYYIYIFALLILVVGLPLSKFLMSLAEIILACNWLLEGGVKNKFVCFWKNKTALILSSLLLLHFVGLFYTDDCAYALKDIRIKVPLLILPLIISTSKPISQKIFDLILYIFIQAIIIGTIISTLILVGIIHRPIVDIRNISIFISHIRFALLICVAVFISAHYFLKAVTNLNKILWFLVIIWLVIFLILMESLTGLGALFIVLIALIIYGIFTIENRILKYGGLIFICCAIPILFMYLNSIVKNKNDKNDLSISKLDSCTSQFNLYEHDLTGKLTENGNLIWINVCKKEIVESWNSRSNIKIGENDLSGNDLYFTLIRFLTSKGLKKDAAGVLLLTDNELKAIERGVPNVNYQSISSLKGRIYETLWEIDLYNTTGVASGHSLTQRFEYWKTAWCIVKNNLLFGVGTGDVPMAFEEMYIKNNSLLNKEWRLRAHNQYLTIAVAFGFIGFIWFLITLIYPILREKNIKTDFIYMTFFIIAIVSFFAEDTLETQAGVTFYAFINSFLLFAKEKK